MSKKIYEWAKEDGASVGIYQQANGEFMALTFSESKPFKTLNGAIRWIAKRGYDVKDAK